MVDDTFIMQETQYHKMWAKRQGNSITFRRTEVVSSRRTVNILGAELMLSDVPKFIEWLQRQFKGD